MRRNNIPLTQKGCGTPQSMVRPSPVAGVSGVSVRLRGGGTCCVLSGRWPIVGRLCVRACIAVRSESVTRDVLDRQ